MGYGNGAALGGGAAGYSGSTSAGLVLPPAPSRPPLVMLELSGTEQRISQLHETISALENRLSHVAQSEPPVATNAAKDRDYPGVQMVATVMQNNASIDVAVSRLQSLLARLEV